MRRELILKSIVTIVLAFVLLSAATVKADVVASGIQDDIAAVWIQGGLLSNTCDYDWWYGCSPTSAGMMMGYYDRNGYSGSNFDNLIPGGTAESETYVGPPTGWAALANNAIASTGHVADYWGTPDPLGSGRSLPADWDCLADFMGTSQGARANGATSFTYWVSGNPYYESQSGTGEGMYGVGLYIEYAGYDAAVLYNQLIPGVADDLWGYTPNVNGFTWDDYVAEIDAGRPVMIQVSGHSMFGYGYGDNNTVYLYDTWSPGPHTMTWGGYYSGLMHYGVMALTLVPLPGAILLGILGIGVVGIKLRKYA